MKKYKPKHLFVDVEATGDGKDHSILEIAAELWTDGKFVDSIYLKMKPYDKDFTCMLNKHGVEINVVKAQNFCKDPNIPLSWVAHQQFTDWLDLHIDKYDKQDKAIMLAYNSAWDGKIIENWFDRNRPNKKYNHLFTYVTRPSVCVAKFANDILTTVGLKDNRVKMKLSNVVKMLNLDIGTEPDWHHPGFDTSVTSLVYYELIKKLVEHNERKKD